MQSGAADLATKNQRLLVQDICGILLSETHSPAAILTWPKTGRSRINEFTTQGYIACAFPTLFPLGSAVLRNTPSWYT